LVSVGGGVLYSRVSTRGEMQTLAGATFAVAFLRIGYWVEFVFSCVLDLRAVFMMSDVRSRGKMNGKDRTYLQHWIRDRDASAFKELTLKYSGLVYATCLRITRNCAEAEDETQECFAALATIGSVPPTPLGVWLHRVATNGSLNRVKAQNRRVSREAVYAHTTENSTEIKWKDIDRFVDEAIAELPEKMRVPIVAHFLDGESYTSVAAALGTSRQTVTYRAEKGIRLLRKALKKRGVPVSVSALAAMMATQLAEATAVPIATSASLGKMALAGALKPTSAGGASTVAGAVSGGGNILGGIVMAKSTVAGVGAAIALVIGGAVYTVQTGNTDGESEPVVLNSVTDDASAGLSDTGTRPFGTLKEDAAMTVASLTAEVTRSHERIAELEARLEAETRADSHASAFDDGAAESPGKGRDSAQVEEQKGTTKKLVSVIMHGSPTAQIDATGRDRYNSLFALLRLPAEVQAQVRDVLVDNLAQQAAEGTPRRTLRSGSFDPSPLEGVLAELLTAEELQLWREYERSPAYYQSLQRNNLYLMENAPGLTEESRALVASILAEERSASDESRAIGDVASIWESEFNIYEYTRARLSGTFESEEQNAFFENFIAQEQDILQERMDSVSVGSQVTIDLEVEYEEAFSIGGVLDSSLLSLLGRDPDVE